MRMSEVKVVGRGVDTLVINVCYADAARQPVKRELAEGLQQELETLQKEARELEESIPTRWQFQEITLYMQPKGSRGPWCWILRSPLVSVAISRGKLNQIIAQVRLSSEYLWSCETVTHAIVTASVFLHNLFGEYLWLQLSSVDLCADITGWDVSHCNWQEGFV